MAYVLLVEDKTRDETIEDRNVQQLFGCGPRLPERCATIVKHSAQDALKLVQTEPLDLVILDIRMPGMDGLEALPRILGLKEGLKVILNTAYSQYQESFMSWAADAYIIKSADLTELKAKVKELLA